MWSAIFEAGGPPPGRAPGLHKLHAICQNTPMGVSGNTAEGISDGRLLRSERSREAIVGALLELVGEGIPQPTAEQVAERAGVGIRTVFRHFSDMESLFMAMDARLEAEVLPLLGGGDRSGGLRRRARALARRRAELFERIGPYRRSGNLVRWDSPFLDKQFRRLVRELRADLRDWIPEVADAPPALLDALEMVLSFEAWDRLRTEQRLGPARTAEALECAALALVARL
jgi:AcrR family transcriptional regulator